MSIRIGHGYDLHRLVPDRRLILAGVEIESERGLAGHSDADVVAHVVIDSLLGAAALGDIGGHFPDTDPMFKNADSMDLLRQVKSMVVDAGYGVGNIDVTIIAQQPKLSSHIETMRHNLSTALEVDIDQVSVKAKTNEGLDAVGREQAIAAHAISVILPL
jgi:2-C-methyl-D-erythritol 2,4-cyclodiphosphate synthase